MWPLLLFVAGIHGLAINLVKFGDIKSQYKKEADQFANCFDASFSYKNGIIFKSFTVEAAIRVRSELCMCIMRGEEFMKLEDDFIQKLDSSQTSKTIKPPDSFIIQNSGDIAPIIEYLTLEKDFVKIAVYTMRRNIEQLDRFIESGDRTILKEEDNTKEVTIVSEEKAVDDESIR